MVKGGFKKVRAIDLGPKPIPAPESGLPDFFNFQQNLWSGIIARKWQTFFSRSRMIEDFGEKNWFSGSKHSFVMI